jgi:uracil phosphoribosyltransferase
MTNDGATLENVFVSHHPLAYHKLTLLRRKETEPKKFREVISELAMMLVYEATQDLQVRPGAIETPLTATTGVFMAEKVGLVPILRAGLGMVEGAWKLLPQSEVWHLGLYRDERTLQPVSYYNKLPVAPTVELCLVLDPMLATGGSAIAAVQVLKHWGVSRIKFVGCWPRRRASAPCTAIPRRGDSRRRHRRAADRPRRSLPHRLHLARSG